MFFSQGSNNIKLRTLAAMVFALATGSGARFALAQVATITLGANDVIYGAGNQASFAAQVGGNVPQAVINIPAGTTAIVAVRVEGSIHATCVSAQGCMTVDGFAYHDPDGLPNNCDYNTGYGSISGFNAPGQGELVGVFLAPNGPSGPAPAAQSYPRSVRVSVYFVL